MCIQYNVGTTVTGPHMDLDLFQRIAEEVFPFVKRWQPSVSGEPTMAKGFYKMLAMARKYGVKLDMVTNATLLNQKMIDVLAPDAGCIMFSFDSQNKKIFEFIREGADFDTAIGNIKSLVTQCRNTLPDDQQPVFGLNSAIMRMNIDLLPDLVEFAHKELRMDFIQINHVYPFTDEMKGQSLVNHRALAEQKIERACEKARELGITLIIQPLDHVTADTALSDTGRGWSTEDGVVEGFEYREVNIDKQRPFPGINQNAPDYDEILRRRAQAYDRSSFPAKRPPDPRATKHEKIWHCDFLWNRSYIHLDGSVRTCCVYGGPIVGTLLRSSFDQLWNNRNYRAIRQRMVMKDPVPACKGCMHIREIEDPFMADYYLQGGRIPTSEEIGKIPIALDPSKNVNMCDDPAGRAPEHLISLPSGNDPEAQGYPGISGRIHADDPMLSSTSDVGLHHYKRVGLEALRLLQEALALAGRATRAVDRILELGCGHGRATRYIAEEFGPRNVSVFDIDTKAARFCERELGVNSIVSRSGLTPSLSGEYDLIWVNGILVQCDERFTQETFALLHDLLSTDGILVFSTLGERSLDLLKKNLYGETVRRNEANIRKSFHDKGFSFVSNECREEPARGISWVSEAYIKTLTQRAFKGKLKLLEQRPGGWDNHHDIYMFHRAPC